MKVAEAAREDAEAQKAAYSRMTPKISERFKSISKSCPRIIGNFRLKPERQILHIHASMTEVGVFIVVGLGKC